MQKSTADILDGGAKAELKRIVKAPRLVAQDIKTIGELVEHVNKLIGHVNKLYEKVAGLEKAVATLKAEKSRR
jgi:archaellum component FlaC